MKIRFKILLLIFYFLLFNNKYVFGDTLESLSNELNSLREEISNLKSEPITNPVLPVTDKWGKTSFGRILKTRPNSNVVTFIETGKPFAKIQTGVLFGKGNIKDIAAARTLQAAADLEAQKIASERSLSIALKEIDAASDFINKSYEAGDIDGALAAISIVEVALSDVSKNIPNDFKTEVLEKGKDFSDTEMKKIQLITKKIDKNKQQAIIDLTNNIEEATSKGFDVKKITDTVITAGVKESRLNDVFQNFTINSLKSSLSETLRYKSIIGETPSKVKYSIKQYEAVTSGDPKKLRAFEIEKFGKAAGLNDEMIQKGINAVYDGNIEIEKDITKNILQKLENNKNFQVKSLSETELDKLMDQALATEQAAKAIKDSGISFGKNSNESDLQKLATEIQNILSGKVDSEKIEKITQNIIYSKNAIIDQKGLSASIIATINGSNYEDAVLKASSGSIAFRAAAVEAALNNNLSELDNIKNDANLNKMSVSQLNELSTIYRDLIEPEQKKAAIESEKTNIMMAYGQSLKKEYELSKENYYNNFIGKGNFGTEAGDAYNKMNELQLKTITSFQYDEIPKDFVDQYKKIEISSIEAIKLTQDSIIKKKQLSDLELQSKEVSGDYNLIKSKSENAVKLKLVAEKNANDAKIAAEKAATLASETVSSNASQEVKDAALKVAAETLEASSLAKSAAEEAAKTAARTALDLASIEAKQSSIIDLKLELKDTIEITTKAAKEATNVAVEIASSQVKEEIQKVTADEIKAAYLKSHLSFEKRLNAMGKNYYDETAGTVLSTFNLEEWKAASHENNLASLEWQAIKGLAMSQDGIAANNAIKEIQKAIETGTVDTSMTENISSSVEETVKETVTETASSVSQSISTSETAEIKEAVQETASEVANSVSESTTEIKETVQEVAQSVSQEVANDIKESVEKSLEELNAEAGEAFKTFIGTKYEGDGSAWKAARQEYLDKQSAASDKWNKTIGCGTEC